MKLYNANLSNFATKCRIVIYEKDAPVEIAPLPGGGLKSPEYLALYPLGMVPSLELEGRVVGESQVINETLEEIFPEPALLPKDAAARARVRWLCAIHDGHLEGPFRATYGHVAPDGRDAALVEKQLGIVNQKLDLIENAIDDGPYLTGNAFTLADCALAPTGVFLEKFVPPLGGKPWTETRPKLAAWWATVQERPSVARALGEQRAAVKERFGM